MTSSGSCLPIYLHLIVLPSRQYAYQYGPCRRLHVFLPHLISLCWYVMPSRCRDGSHAGELGELLLVELDAGELLLVELELDAGEDRTRPRVVIWFI